MKFSETVKLNQSGLVVSPRHEAWLADNDTPRYTGLALGFAMKQLGDRGRFRKGTVSASSLGECRRYQQFVYLGMPKMPPTPQSAMRMHNGAMMHLRWQMAGLSEGWLTDAEVPVRHPTLGLTGTMDGVLYDGSVLELKSINSHGFSRVSTFGPLIPHLFQMATYMLCTRRKQGVFIYENKNDQDYQEIVVSAADLPMSEVQSAAVEMWRDIETKHLAEPLSKCLDREGWVYNYCPFRDRCLEIKSWEEVS
jgi:hypothetical protein